MKIINLKQGSSDWLKWRRTKICGSEASSICGVNPWKSAIELYEQKIFEIEQEDNELMARGRALEPIALSKFESEMDEVFFPLVVESSEIEWMGASLDGMTMDNSQFVEIKCGRSSFKQMQKGQIIQPYLTQLQHQMAVTGLERCFYYCYCGDTGVGLCAIVERDNDFIKKMMEKETEFWYFLRALKPPIKSEKIECSNYCYSMSPLKSNLREELAS